MAKKKRGLTYAQADGLAKKLAAKHDALEEAIKLRCSDLYRLLGTTDHDLIAWKAESEGYLIAAMMVREAMEGPKPKKPCREPSWRSGGSRK